MLKGGFIGFGRMGITHFSILNSNPLVVPVAVCDQSKTMMTVLSRYVDINIYSDYEKMISESDLDFVVISTPSDSHAEIINHAVEHNLHIFTEKPFSMNAAEGRVILNRMEGKTLVNQVGYVNRFNEVFVAAKKIIESGLLGEIKTFTSEMNGATVLKDTKGSWRSKVKSGGGCLYEFASHCIDLVVYLLGAPSGIKGSVLQSIYSSSVEDRVAATFIYDSGCIGSIHVNWSDPAYRKPTNVMTVSGTKGTIIADKHVYKVFLKEDDPNSDFKKGWNTRYLTDFAEGVRFYLRGNEFTRQLDYFIDCIKSGSSGNVCNFADALETDIIMDRIREDHGRPALKYDQTMGIQEHATVFPTKKSFWHRLFK